MTIWQIWWLALAVKTILLPIIPITPDEAYYLTWARHPSLSYFDHPPFIAWIMTAALPLWKTTVGIRWPGVIFSHLGYIPWFAILRKLNFSERAQIFWMLGMLIGPLTGLGGFVITPDVPLVFFWSLGIWSLLWVSERPAISRWLLVGLFAGLGMLSKYVMILFFPATLAWMIWDKKIAELKKPGIWLAVIVSLLVFSPVIIWNWQNDFASFAFQTRHGLSSGGFRWNWPVEYIATQLALLNPFIAIMGFVALYRYPKKYKLFVVFTITPFLFFFLTSFRARVEANWPVCAYPSFMVLCASLIDTSPSREKWVSWMKSALAIAFVFVLLVISHTVRPWLPINKNKDHTEITREWLVDVAALKDYHPLYARSYQMAAFHSYYRSADHEVFKLAGLDRMDFYDFLPQATPHQPSYIILKGDDKFPPTIKDRFELKNPQILPSHLVVYQLIPK